MFSKLFEMLPDAEDLLNLEPEELAGPLLVSLENREKINLQIIIGYDRLAWEINQNALNIPNLNYPKGTREDVLFALMEAWQCLVSEGFVAPRPTDLPKDYFRTSAATYFVTRRGKKIETLEDFEAYRQPSPSDCYSL